MWHSVQHRWGQIPPPICRLQKSERRSSLRSTQGSCSRLRALSLAHNTSRTSSSASFSAWIRFHLTFNCAALSFFHFFVRSDLRCILRKATESPLSITEIILCGAAITSPFFDHHPNHYTPIVHKVKL